MGIFHSNFTRILFVSIKLHFTKLCTPFSTFYVFYLKVVYSCHHFHGECHNNSMGTTERPALNHLMVLSPARRFGWNSAVVGAEVPIKDDV